MDQRRKPFLTPSRSAVAFAILLVLAFVASLASMPARAGGGGASPASITRAASSPQHRFATRTGIVYPLELPQVTASDVASLAQHSRGSRRLKRLRASATSLDETLPELPSLATLALTATPNVST